MVNRMERVPRDVGVRWSIMVAWKGSGPVRVAPGQGEGGVLNALAEPFSQPHCAF